MRVPSVVLFAALAACNAPIAENEAPSIKFESHDDGSVVNEGEDLVFQILLRDRDGDNGLTLTLSSSVDGELGGAEDIETGTTVEIVAPLTLGEHVLTAVATDPKGGVRESSIALTLNARPSDPVISVTPAEATTNDQLVGDLVTASVDPEEALMLHDWFWTGTRSNGEVVALEGVSFPATVPSTETAKGDTWEFCVVASEGGINEDGQEVYLNGGIAVEVCETRVIGNIAPGVPVDVELLPLSPTPADSLLCDVTVDAPDLDGDSVSYEYSWQVDRGTGSFVDSGLTGMWLDASETEPGELWQCTATSFDGQDTGGNRTVSVAIGPRNLQASSAPVYVDGTAGMGLGQIAVGAPMETVSAADDLVVGVSLDDAQGPLAGRAAVFRMSGAVPNQTWQSQVSSLSGGAGALLGASLASPGDIDGDGLTDLVIGAPGSSIDGLVYVQYGQTLSSAQLPSDSGWTGSTLASPATTSDFGTAVSGADVDNDGAQDVVVARRPAAGAGQVFLYEAANLSRGATTSTADATITSSLAGFGAVLASGGGDVNGNGSEDVVVASPTATAGAAVWVFEGALLAGSLDDSDAASTVAAVSGAEVGASAAVGDIDGDGVDDLVVGAPGLLGGAGGVGIFFGPIGASLSINNADVLIAGASPGDRFGQDVVILGDTGADGAAELSVGAPGAASGSGRAYVFVGGDLVDLVANGQGSTADAALQVTGSGGEALTVRGPGYDLTGDGVGDLLLAGPDAASGAGRVYVFGH